MDINALINLEFLETRKAVSHFHENYELLYIIHGNLNLTVEEEIFSLKPEDVVLINAWKKHQFQANEDVLIGIFSFPSAMISELLDQNLILFWCNTAVDKNDAYDELRAVIIKILNQYFETSKEGHIYLNSLYYQILYILTSHFLLTKRDIQFETKKDKFDNRMNEITHYIRANYNRNISLQDLANRLYLSSAYLSKFIKEKYGANFKELVNAVRLNHAMEDLIHTDSPIIKIAMDNGFTSVAAFNKVFKDFYQKTPSAFRKSTQIKANEDETCDAENKNKLIRAKLRDYLGRKPVTQPRRQDGKEKLIKIDIRSDHPKLWSKNWNRLINAGTALDLSRSVFQEHIVYLKENLHFDYVRFWDLYSPDMLIDVHAPRDTINFGRLNFVLDFLVSNEIKPYIELGVKPIRLLRTTNDALMEIPREVQFHSLDEMENFYYVLVKHLVKRYGPEEVGTWYFERWKRESLRYLDYSFNFEPHTEEQHMDYFEKFDAVAGGIKRGLPNAQIGGGGFSLQHYGQNGLRNLLETWKKYKYQPDFISLNCFPYQLERDGNTYFERKSTDVHFVKNNVEILTKIIKEAEFEVSEIHVSEYNLSLSNRNVINDYYGKGAFLMQTLIDCVDCVDMMGYWLGSDIYADLHDSRDFLFGGVGLLNKTGIPKPAFYAFDFLNKMYKYLWGKGDNFVVTENGNGSWRIACHNFKKYNYRYYLSSEDKINIDDIPFMVEDENPLQLHIKFENIKNGIYTIKTYTINQNYGSIQDEWVRLGMESDLNIDELEYINRICTPQLAIKKYSVDKNVMGLKIYLEPNEMQYLDISL